MKYVVGFGGATCDLHIRSDGPVLLRDSNPATTSTSPGGVMRNILENLSRLGDSTKFISAVGDDANGRTLLESCETVGIDTNGVMISNERPTALYIDFLAPDGDMFVAANDMKIIDTIPGAHLDSVKELIQGATLAIADANLPTETLMHFVRIAKEAEVPVFFDTVSASKAARVIPLIDEIALLKPNAMELSVLTDMPTNTADEIKAAAKSLIERGVQAVAVTLGSEGAYYVDSEGEEFFEKLDPVHVMANATGAGDAFTAGLAHGYLGDKTPRDMVRFALGCGKLAVQSETTINPDMSVENVQKEIG